MRKDNNEYINFYIGIAVILALLANISFLDDRLVKIATATALPMVFFVFGVNNKEMMEKPELWFAKNYIGTYCWFSLFYTSMDAMRTFTTGNRNLLDVKRDILDSVTFFGCGVLWYLPVLFLAGAVYRFLRKHTGKIVTLLVFLLALIIDLTLMRELPEMMMASDTLPKMIFTRIFMVCWRSMIAGLFISLGEWTKIVGDGLIKRKAVFVVISFIITAIGMIILAINPVCDIKDIYFVKPWAFFPAVLMVLAGLLWLCQWIARCYPIEFIGMNARIIYLTAMIFLAVRWGHLLNNYLVKVFNNDFLGRTSAFLLIIAVEMIYIIVINRFFGFVVGRDNNKTFGLITRSEED